MTVAVKEREREEAVLRKKDVGGERNKREI